MLQPASITSLLSQLIHQDPPSFDAIRPHTALLTLVESSELYAVATRLVDVPPPKSAVASILASTAAATGTALLAAKGTTAVALTLDERAACLSALAVTAWRQATEAAKAKTDGKVVMPGASVKVAKHAVTGIKAENEVARELVPLLLESDLGRILVMPIVPSGPLTSVSRGETVADEEHEDGQGFAQSRKPLMLLTLNAASDIKQLQTVATTPQNPSSNTTTSSPALASSTATLSANNPTRSRLRSGVTTPTSTRSDLTATPSRSPVSDHFPIHAVPGAGGETDAVATHEAGEQDAKEAKIWSGLYAQAKALARVLAPSLAKCGVGEDGEEHAEGRMSAGVSDDDAET